VTRADALPARDRLIEATKRLIWERGIEATSPGAILTESGVGQGSLYHHFTGKPELAATAAASLATDLQAETDVVLGDEEATAMERVHAYLDKQRDALSGCRLGRLAFDPGRDAQTGAPIAAYFAGLQRTLTSLLDDARIDGDLTDVIDTGALASAIVACVQGGYVLAAATQDPDAMAQAMLGIRHLLDAAAPHRRRNHRPR